MPGPCRSAVGAAMESYILLEKTIIGMTWKADMSRLQKEASMGIIGYVLLLISDDLLSLSVSVMNLPDGSIYGQLMLVLQLCCEERDRASLAGGDIVYD